MTKKLIRYVLVFSVLAGAIALYRVKIDGGQPLAVFAGLGVSVSQWLSTRTGDVTLPEVSDIKRVSDSSPEAEGGWVYRWRDDNGQMNFSYEPPSDGTPYEQVAMPEVKNTFAPENMPYPRKAKPKSQ